jgi:Lysylphosphatidylglycerol synthase TM region
MLFAGFSQKYVIASFFKRSDQAIIQFPKESHFFMGQAKEKGVKPARYTAFGIIFSLLGILLFAYFVKKAGVGEIIGGIRRLGFGFALIFLLGGVRQAVHAVCWIKCCEPPYRLRFIDVFRARLMGEALGNILPLGPVAVSEPSKPFFLRDRVPLMASASALAIENIFYALSVALFISAGAIALLLRFELPNSLRYVSIGALVAVVVIVPLGFLLIRLQLRFLSGALGFVGGRGIARKSIAKVKPRLRMMEDRIYGFYERHHSRFFLILLIEMSYHAAGILEGYLTLFFISTTVGPTLMTAFILESVNRVINVVFKFIPLRAGVDEGGTGKVSTLLGFTNPTGVTLAIVRKGRDICWTAVGLALIFHRGISLRSAARRVEEVAEDQEIRSADDALAAVSAGKSA